MRNQSFESLGFMLTPQQGINQRNINTQAVSNPCWPDSIGVKFSHQFNLTPLGQVTATAVAIGRAGGSGISDSHGGLYSRGRRSCKVPRTNKDL